MISIIIPVFNEEVALPILLKHLNECEKIDQCELLIVDGGSTDNTAKVAEAYNCTLYLSPQKGRAAQMNYGSQVAHGDIFYFLHVDTLPPSDFVDQFTEKINTGFGAGCFRLMFDDDHPVLKFYAWFTRFDLDVLRFGDQSLFVEKSIFKSAGGFDERLVVMEDQIIVKDLKRLTKFCILHSAVITSARKYRENGVIRLQLIFTTILILFYLKVPQEKLVQFYRRFIR